MPSVCLPQVHSGAADSSHCANDDWEADDPWLLQVRHTFRTPHPRRVSRFRGLRIINGLPHMRAANIAL